MDPVGQQYSRSMLEASAAGKSRLYIGVRTTGIFCRPGCPARPKPTNKVLYESARQALGAGYRPCKRCRPLSHPQFTSPPLQSIVAAIEAAPDRVWHDLEIDSITPYADAAVKEFHQRFGMSLAEYARLRRKMHKSPDSQQRLTKKLPSGSRS